jgi:hypothetical protein
MKWKLISLFGLLLLLGVAGWLAFKSKQSFSHLRSLATDESISYVENIHYQKQRVTTLHLKGELSAIIAAVRADIQRAVVIDEFDRHIAFENADKPGEVVVIEPDWEKDPEPNRFIATCSENLSFLQIEDVKRRHPDTDTFEIAH